jgi:hypothetical protein
MKMIWRACGLLGGLILFGSTAMAIETKPTLTLDLAKKMAAGCEAKAKQENWKMSLKLGRVMLPPITAQIVSPKSRDQELYDRRQWRLG